MDDGGAVILSVAKYYSPAGKAIQDTGAVPANLVAKRRHSGMDDDSDAAKADVNEPEHKPGEDLMLKKALDCWQIGRAFSGTRRFVLFLIGKHVFVSGHALPPSSTLVHVGFGGLCRRPSCPG
jgi:hypothetical protein